jgi:SET domain-containing protein
VRGELAIGLFTLRDIGAGEELTFDYNFERYGDKPMRCYCSATGCAACGRRRRTKGPPAGQPASLLQAQPCGRPLRPLP